MNYLTFWILVIYIAGCFASLYLYTENINKKDDKGRKQIDEYPKILIVFVGVIYFFGSVFMLVYDLKMDK